MGAFQQRAAPMEWGFLAECPASVVTMLLMLV